MKTLSIGATLLSLAIAIAGCKYGGQAKMPVEKEKPAAAGATEQKARVEHNTMKPVTPPTGTEAKPTTPAIKNAEAKAEGGTQAKASAKATAPEENK